MAKKKQNKLQTKWIFVLGIAAVILAGFGLLKNNTSQPKQQETSYQTYQNSTYGFSIEYPQSWETRNNTQVFENGDAIAFGIDGPTQKKQTELTDGAQVAIAKPFYITTDLATWLKSYFNTEAKFSQMTLTKYPFEAVENCTNLGCMTYYFVMVNKKVYGIAVFTQGPDKDKMIYENTTLYMLKSLKFDNVENGIISKENAVAKVKNLPEVIDYLKRVPNGIISVNGEEDNAYLVQVYELKNDHTATFNWYSVDKSTGVVEKQF